MRLANLGGRAVLLTDGTAIDVESASGGRFAADPTSLYRRWDEFRSWADGVRNVAGEPVEPASLGPPVPEPRQVFGIGLNYGAHAAESGVGVPAEPAVFTKFPTCIAGPVGDVALPDGDSRVDWEIELVVVIGRTARDVPASRAWEHVAGLTAGQDLSERTMQFAGPVPQFSLGKSHPGFGPTGPCLVTPEEFDDPDDLRLRSSLNGECVQDGRTGQMVLPVAELVARLSRTVTLLPGDLIFTGTPEGVGFARQPPRYLAPGDELVSDVEGIGELRQRVVEPRSTRNGTSHV
ncbi:fumarylacetoacetate hydrolase family protein [Actinomadura sp. NPDC047616]|uniref:fumarylacetoacetate hydrolase family protein n=1 Tax=Actinomadura sp. NPDC047616 TaxID=3155914 RepID=UPI0033C58C30